MYRLVACSIVCLFAVSSSAGEPPSRQQHELSEIKRLLSDLTRRVGKLEIAMKGQWPAGGVAIDFDQFRIPYDSDDERERVRAQVASKGREAFRTGQFLTDAGWRRVTVGNSGNIESGVIRSSASSLETGLMSGILDDGKALYILHVTKRTQ